MASRLEIALYLTTNKKARCIDIPIVFLQQIKFNQKRPETKKIQETFCEAYPIFNFTLCFKNHDAASCLGLNYTPKASVDTPSRDTIPLIVLG
jgi:hypothetical protein